MADYPSPPNGFTVTGVTAYGEQAEGVADALASALGLEAAIIEVKPMSEHEFLYGESPHPAVVAHTAAVVERVQALTPPSLVKLDRAETALAAVVARRKLEQAGQFQTDQWWDLKRYEDGLVDNYIEATT